MGLKSFEIEKISNEFGTPIFREIGGILLAIWPQFNQEWRKKNKTTPLIMLKNKGVKVKGRYLSDRDIVPHDEIKRILGTRCLPSEWSGLCIPTTKKEMMLYEERLGTVVC